MTTERANQIEAELRAAGGQPVQIVPDGQTLVLFIGEPHREHYRVPSIEGIGPETAPGPIEHVDDLGADPPSPRSPGTVEGR